jgi:glucose-6-phosphate isomerase, archaeal
VCSSDLKMNLNNTTGFSIWFDPETLEVTAGDGFELKPVSRNAGQLSGVLCFPQVVDSSQELYRNYLLEKIPEKEKKVLAIYNLSYSFVMMPPLKVGSEYVKTNGHYHPPIPGTRLGFPEVYTQLYGTLVLLLQKAGLDDRHQVTDFAAIEMTPGTIVTIPPDYAHILINKSNEPALMAGLYGSQTSFMPDYAPIEQLHGLAYYLFDEGGTVKVEPNLKYKNVPSFRWVSDLHSTAFEPVDDGKPVWKSYMENPNLYAFLTKPEAAQKKFGSSISIS